jgi:hypothetical protein
VCRITNDYNNLRENYINAPDSHPKMNEEWNKFYDRRAQEVENEGKNPDNVDFGAEWIPFWLKRMQEIMKEETLQKM